MRKTKTPLHTFFSCPGIRHHSLVITQQLVSFYNALCFQDKYNCLPQLVGFLQGRAAVGIPSSKMDQNFIFWVHQLNSKTLTLTQHVASSETKKRCPQPKPYPQQGVSLLTFSQQPTALILSVINTTSTTRVIECKRSTKIKLSEPRN